MGEGRRPGLTAGLRSALTAGLGGVQTRLELLAVEVQEERIRVAALLFNTILAALFIGFGAVFLAAFLTVLWWEEHRLLALGLAALLFFALGIWAAANAAREHRSGSRLFAASLAELSRDRAALEREP